MMKSMSLIQRTVLDGNLKGLNHEAGDHETMHNGVKMEANLHHQRPAQCQKASFKLVHPLACA